MSFSSEVKRELCLRESFDRDTLRAELYGMLLATNALLGEDEYCMDYLEAYRDNLFGPIKD